VAAALSHRDEILADKPVHHPRRLREARLLLPAHRVATVCTEKFDARRAAFRVLLDIDPCDRSAKSSDRPT
jgi:hypothetical protein